MKYFLISLIIFFSHQIFAQLEKEMRYVDGTVINYDIRKNDPELFPNINFEIGGSLGRLTYSPLAFNLETGFRMKFKRYGLHVVYTQLLAKELMEDVIYSTNSDNSLNNFYELKTGFDFDIWTKTKFRKGVLLLKTISAGGPTKITYHTKYDSVKSKNQLSFQTGYQTHTGAVSNGMRKNQSYYLTDVNGFALVQNRPEIVNADLYDQREYVNFHTNLKAHLLYFGLNYSIHQHIILKYITNRSVKLKTNGRSYQWGIYGHFLLNLVNDVEPIKLDSDVNIYSPVDNRFLYRIPRGEYDVHHSGDGGLDFNPFGWRIGTYLHISNMIHPLIPGSKSFIELGMLPGLKGHQSLGADVDMNTFFIKIGVMLSFGLNTSKKTNPS